MFKSKLLTIINLYFARKKKKRKLCYLKTLEFKLLEPSSDQYKYFYTKNYFSMLKVLFALHTLLNYLIFF